MIVAVTVRPGARSRRAELTLVLDWVPSMRAQEQNILTIEPRLCNRGAA